MVSATATKESNVAAWSRHRCSDGDAHRRNNAGRTRVSFPDSPCGATPIPICAFVPVLPGLDHDVDLTTGPDPDTQTPNDAQSQVPAIDGR